MYVHVWQNCIHQATKNSRTLVIAVNIYSSFWKVDPINDAWYVRRVSPWWMCQRIVTSSYDNTKQIWWNTLLSSVLFGQRQRQKQFFPLTIVLGSLDNICFRDLLSPHRAAERPHVLIANTLAKVATIHGHSWYQAHKDSFIKGLLVFLWRSSQTALPECVS